LILEVSLTMKQVIVVAQVRGLMAAEVLSGAGMGLCL